jgi:glycosyltransferase involved in cell wall biosynthesis
VSIGLPVRNGETYLAEAIASLLAQTFDDLELIISDNASTDCTRAICEAFVRQDPRVRYVREDEDRGAAWNYNRTFELSRGGYFKWATDDDLHDPRYLETCVDRLDADPETVWCHTRTLLIGPDGRPLDGPAGGVLSYAPAPTATHGTRHRGGRESDDVAVRLRSILIESRGVRDIFGLMRTEAVRRTSLHLPIYGADKVLVAELALQGRYREVPEVLFLGRVHPRASSALGSAAEQRRWIAGDRGPRPVSPRLAILQAHCRAIRRADLTTAERARCYAVIGRYLLQVRKWRAVFGGALAGSGTGGGYLPALRTLDTARPASRTPGPRSQS